METDELVVSCSQITTALVAFSVCDLQERVTVGICRKGKKRKEEQSRNEPA
jgi:hypothetical protein